MPLSPPGVSITSMATVHPSRLGLVPGAKNPPPARRASPPIPERPERRAPEPPAQPLSREEELRQKLLARRRSNGQGPTPKEGKSLADRIGGVGGPSINGADGRPQEIRVKGRGKLRAWSDDERDNTAGPSSMGAVEDERSRTEDHSRASARRSRSRSLAFDKSGTDGRRTRSPSPRTEHRSLSRERYQGPHRADDQSSRDSRSPYRYRRRSRSRGSPPRRDTGSDRSQRYDDRRYDDRRSYRRSRSPPADPRNQRPSPSYRNDQRPSPAYPARSPLRLGFDSPPVGLRPPQHAMPPFPPSRPPPGSAQYGYGPGRHDLGAPSGPPAGQPSYLGPPQRIGFDSQPRNQGRGPSNLEQRREEREKSTISIWPPSPKEPYKDEEELEAERKAAKKARKDKSSRSKRKSRRYDDETSSDDSDNGYDSGDRRRSRRRHASRRDDDSETESDSNREYRKRRSERRRRRRYSDDSESADSEHAESSRRRRSEKKRKHKRRYDSEDTDDSGRGDRSSRRRTRTRTPDAGHKRVAGDDQWVEKRGESSAIPSATLANQALPSDDEEVGPQLPSDIHHKDRRDKYSNMLKGEAEAMAAFAAAGQRIPRRGEIGIDSDKIQAFEDAGYVMSGNRNKRMNAVRLRKENQVINAEEKRAILNLQREEKLRKEGAIISQFKEMMDETLRKQGLKGMHDI